MENREVEAKIKTKTENREVKYKSEKNIDNSKMTD